MEYSKDIILGINYADVKVGQAVKNEKKSLKNIMQSCNGKLLSLIKRHKLIATISVICGILMVMDYILVYNFMVLLQTLA